MLCSSLLADKISHFEVLSDHRMGSDHAPILCTLGVEKEFRVGVTAPEPRFNFNKADWNKYDKVLDEMIDQVDSEDISELNEIFSSLIINSAEKSIPKISINLAKSYPKHILVDIINNLREVRKDKKKSKSRKSKDPQY